MVKAEAALSDSGPLDLSRCTHPCIPDTVLALSLAPRHQCIQDTVLAPRLSDSDGMYHPAYQRDTGLALAAVHNSTIHRDLGCKVSVVVTQTPQCSGRPVQCEATAAANFGNIMLAAYWLCQWLAVLALFSMRSSFVTEASDPKRLSIGSSVPVLNQPVERAQASAWAEGLHPGDGRTRPKLRCRASYD